jgi:two-component system, chemotaxis family, sensor kinase Cph1
MIGSIESLRPGSHGILLYRDRVEQFASMVSYIRIGLARNERCLYVAGDNPVRMVIEALEQGGIDVVDAERRGQLTIASHRETYLKCGLFEPRQMAEDLQEEIRKSLRDGFTAFRGTGEMGWAAAVPPALLRLYEYEALIDRAMSGHFIALCQYNEKLFSPALISRMLRIHSTVVARGSVVSNPHYVGPEKFLLNGFDPLTVEDVIPASA